MKTDGLTIDTANPQALAAWWAKALGVEIGTDYGVLVALVTPSDLLPLQFFKCEMVPEGRNRVHPDFKTPDLDAETERLVAMVATIEQKTNCHRIVKQRSLTPTETISIWFRNSG